MRKLLSAALVSTFALVHLPAFAQDKPAAKTEEKKAEAKKDEAKKDAKAAEPKAADAKKDEKKAKKGGC